jgi:hypothetical protein
MAVDRNYILNKMKGKMMTPAEFNFDAMQAPPLYSLLTPTDIGDLHKLATSIRYAGNPLLRFDQINQIMNRRGFKKMTGGTNRLIYRFLEDNSIIVKVASDAVGVGDSPREYINQQIFKPFVTKVFEVSPCGTVGLFERVMPITSREEFLSIAPDVFEAISNIFTGEYVMDDIGTDYFLNWGVRIGFGPVLLDFPYAYKLDGNKLFCNIPEVNNPGHTCGGVIDYDAGYNHLRCTKCGVIYKAKELEDTVKNKTVLVKGGESKMKVSFGSKDAKVVKDTKKYMDVSPKLVSKKRTQKSKVGSLKVTVVDTFKKKNVEEEKQVVEEKVEAVVTEEKQDNRGKVTATPIPNTNAKEEERPNVDEGLKPVAVVYNSMVTNSEILGITGPRRKYITLCNATTGEALKVNGSYIVIESIDGRDVMNLAIVAKDAIEDIRDSYTTSIDELKEEMKEDYEEYQKELEEYKETIAQLKSELEELKAPYYYDKQGKKRDKKTNRFYAEKKEEPVEETVEEEKAPEEPEVNYPEFNSYVVSPDEEPVQFNVESPLMKDDDEEETEEDESMEDIKNDIIDKDIVDRIDKLIPDDTGEGEEEQKEPEPENTDVPVGAAPPANNSSNTRKSMRYDKNFYNKSGKKGKKK